MDLTSFIHNKSGEGTLGSKDFRNHWVGKHAEGAEKHFDALDSGVTVIKIVGLDDVLVDLMVKMIMPNVINSSVPAIK